MDRKTATVCSGSIAFVSSAPESFCYGDSRGLPGFSGAGIFSVGNGFLFGIARGNEWEGKQTSQYGDVLEIIPATVSGLSLWKPKKTRPLGRPRARWTDDLADELGYRRTEFNITQLLPIHTATPTRATTYARCQLNRWSKERSQVG
ncbi:hypothetical protein FO519_008501 [Halicephalobus sp. NKZ332]|nr:hypothetical protein FO519_008501 [Halicephalobus sp. NKZ332]